MAPSRLRVLGLVLLAVGLSVLIPACGDEDVPAPTTPAPPPTPPPAPPPEPEPEAPAVPTGLRILATGMDFIEWAWTPVQDVSGYDVQFSANEAFTDEDEVIARTAEEITYRRDGLDAGTNAYLRVRSATGTGEDRITSDWSTHVTGMTMAAPPPPEPPATPTGLMVSETTDDSITWTWDAVEGATAYIVQTSLNEMFDDGDDATARTLTPTFTVSDLEPGTTVYLRVRAAAGTSAEDAVLSPWSSHVTGMATAPAPARPPAPANLDVKSRGSSFIEWEWDEVAGASGYQAQFSTDSSFDGANTFELSGASSTTYRVANLQADSDGYFRVRAYVGSRADRVFGEWSAADRASTDEPPAPVVTDLDAPENVRSTGRTETSITVEWDDVDDAEGYEVDQKLRTATSWGDAACGTAGVVTDLECEATGLTRATEYDFRVRALADDDDATKRDSGWSGTFSRATSGTAPPPVVTETSDLNVRWESTDNSITWNWDPVEDRELRGRTEYLVQVIATGKCAELLYVPDETGSGRWADSSDDDDAWQNRGSNISLTRTAGLGVGSVKGLCIVATWTNELANEVMVRTYGTPELVWASTAPALSMDTSTPPVPVATAVVDARTSDTTRETTSLTWDYVMNRGFDYPGRMVVSSRNDDAPDADDCEDGTEVPSKTRVTTANVQVTHEQQNPDDYSYYRFCVQAKNDHGESGLVSVGGNRETRPTVPNTVSFSTSASSFSTESWGGDKVTEVVWTVAEKKGTPRRAEKYAAKAFRSTLSSIKSTIVQSTCADPSGLDGYFDVSGGRSNTGNGIAITATAPTNLVGGFLTHSSIEAAPDEYYFYACVQADPSTNDDDEGLWAISTARKFIGGRPATPSDPAELTSDNTSSVAAWTLTPADGATGHQVQWAEGAAVTDANGSSPVPVSATATTYRLAGRKASTTYHLRVRQYRTISSRRLFSDWSGSGTSTTLSAN